MRYRDQPTVEVTQVKPCDVATAWNYSTDITVPAPCSTELQPELKVTAAGGTKVYGTRTATALTDRG